MDITVVLFQYLTLGIVADTVADENQLAVLYHLLHVVFGYGYLFSVCTDTAAQADALDGDTAFCG